MTQRTLLKHLMFLTYFVIALESLVHNFFESMVNVTFGGILTIILILTLLCRPKTIWAFANFGNNAVVPLLYLLVVYAAVSLSWSEFTEMDIGIKGMFLTILPLYCIHTMLSTTFSKPELIHSGLKGYLAGNFLVLLIVLVLGPEKMQERGGTSLLDPNFYGLELGFCAFTSYFFSLYRTNLKKKGLLGLTLFFTGGLFLTLSKTCISAYLVTFTVFVISMEKRTNVKLQFLGAIGILGMLLFPVIATKLASYKDFATLTGRTWVWEFALEMFHQHPLRGFGYRSLWTYTDEAMAFPYMHAHNQWINILFHYGVLGFTIFLFILFSLFSLSVKAVKKLPDNRPAKYVISFLVFYLIVSVTLSNHLLLMPHILLIQATWLASLLNVRKTTQRPLLLIKNPPLLTPIRT